MNPMTKYTFALLAVVTAAHGHAQAIRKIVDAKGVTYYTNQAPEEDQVMQLTPVVPLPIVSNPVVPVTPNTQVLTANLAAAPANPSSAPVKRNLPANPAQALGDWPPKLKAAPCCNEGQPLPIKAEPPKSQH
jgi:hypothetical protein